jgi:hypothetical protein
MCAIPIMSALLALHGGCTGCPDNGRPDESFGVARYQVVGTAIDIDTGQELSDATISLVAYGFFYGSRSDVDQPLTARTDDAGAFALPALEMIVGLHHVPPGYMVLEAESSGRTACALAMRRAIQWRDADSDILEVGRVAFDFTAGPCDLARPAYDPDTGSWVFP